jgi:phosphinothricin acetyltransferase
MIRPATTEDAAQICDIYNHYVRQTTITFEVEPVESEEMEQRISEVLKDLPWLVWEEVGSIRGFAYASKWKGRCAYRYSVEATVYIHPDDRGRGIGSQLYQKLLSQLRN